MDTIASVPALAHGALNPAEWDVSAIRMPGAVRADPVAPALDPRPAHTLSPSAAQAVLSLTPGIVTPAEGGVLAPGLRPGPVERTWSIAGAGRNETSGAGAPVGDANGSGGVPHGTDLVGPGTEVRLVSLSVQAAALVAQFFLPNLRTAVAESETRDGVSSVSNDATSYPSGTELYVLCDAENYSVFVRDNPHLKTLWLNVDSRNIVLYWPRERYGVR